MRKIPTLFARDFEHNPRYVTRDVTPGCEWVIKGEGVPTRKYDGTCVMFDGTAWWARREVKQDKMPPPGFVALETDLETGKTVGWEPVEQSAFYRWFADARAEWAYPQPGTYELLGPKVNGNPEGAQLHIMVRHDRAEHLDELQLDDVPRDFDGLAAWLHAHRYEGIVWHHEDGRMAKIKKRDFPAPAATAHTGTVSDGMTGEPGSYEEQAAAFIAEVGRIAALGLPVLPEDPAAAAAMRAAGYKVLAECAAVTDGAAVVSVAGEEEGAALVMVASGLAAALGVALEALPGMEFLGVLRETPGDGRVLSQFRRLPGAG